MNYLIIAAHPDDEVLGAGATINKLSNDGHNVYVMLASHVSATRESGLDDKARSSCSLLGVKDVFIGDFQCMHFKDAYHHDMVVDIENAIRKSSPEVVITHHPADIHIDHRILSECVMEAVRLPQRQIEQVSKIRQVLFMEVPSSSDWSSDQSLLRFSPNVFSEVSDSDIKAKIKAVSIYESVIRSEPHPRSEAAINALSVIRGAMFGVPKAEAFQLAFGEML